MDIYEASRNYNIPMEILRTYERWEILSILCPSYQVNLSNTLFYVLYFVQLRIAKVNLVTGTQDSSTSPIAHMCEEFPWECYSSGSLHKCPCISSPKFRFLTRFFHCLV